MWKKESFIQIKNQDAHLIPLDVCTITRNCTVRECEVLHGGGIAYKAVRLVRCIKTLWEIFDPLNLLIVLYYMRLADTCIHTSRENRVWNPSAASTHKRRWPLLVWWKWWERTLKADLRINSNTNAYVTLQSYHTPPSLRQNGENTSIKSGFFPPSHPNCWFVQRPQWFLPRLNMR